MITIITATADREDIAFATRMAEKCGLDGPGYFINELINAAIQQMMEQEHWSSELTDRYCPKAMADDLDDGIPI